MLEKTITFKDYNNNVRTETHYFNLNSAEVIEWLTTTGDYTMDDVLKKLSEERNGSEIIRIFKDLIYRSYGKKSVDGRRFIKTEDVKAEFMETEAYATLFMELVTDAKKAADFVSSIIPSSLYDEVNSLMSSDSSGIVVSMVKPGS